MLFIVPVFRVVWLKYHRFDVKHQSINQSTLLQVMELGMLAMEGAFNIPNYRGTGRVCLTNLPSNGAFRGFGTPQGTFIIHSIMYDIAKHTGIPFNKVRQLIKGYNSEFISVPV